MLWCTVLDRGKEVSMALNTSVTATDIARIAQVSRTTVSNWRRRLLRSPIRRGAVQPTFQPARLGRRRTRLRRTLGLRGAAPLRIRTRLGSALPGPHPPRLPDRRTHAPAAFSQLPGRRMRRELLRRGVLSAVIGLPIGAAVPLHVGLHLWVLERPDTEATQQQQVLFIDAENNRTEDEERRTTAWEGLRARVVQTWRTFLEATGEPDGAVDAPRFSRAVPVVELLDESVDLTPQRHLPVAAPRVSAEKAHEGAGTMRRRLLRTLDDTRSSVPGQGWKVRDLGEWRMTTVDDLARFGALVLHRAPSAPVVEPDEGTGPRVLTPADVNRGQEPSKRLAEPVAWTPRAPGDPGRRRAHSLRHDQGPDLPGPGGHR